MGPDRDLGVLGRLVRATYSRELLDLAGPRLLVQALRVALLGDLDGDVDVDLDERDGLVVGALPGGRRVQVARQLPVRAERRDEGRDGDAGAVREQLGHFADAPDVLGAVRVAEAQVLV